MRDFVNPTEDFLELRESDLKNREIDRKTAEEARLKRVTSQVGALLVGRPHKACYDGIVIPYLWPGEPQPFNAFTGDLEPLHEARREDAAKNDADDTEMRLNVFNGKLEKEDGSSG